MALFERTEVIPWEEFFGKETKQDEKIDREWWLSFFAVVPVMGRETIRQKIMQAFDPLIEAAQGICYPISILMMIWGLILIGLDNRSAGISKIKSAIMLYLGINWLPWIMELLSGVAETISPR